MEKEYLLEILKKRFEDNMKRHENIAWDEIEHRLKNDEEALEALIFMEETEGEPDVVGYDDEKGVYVFMDCSKESPKGRRSCCYDDAARESRKKNKPDYSALGLIKDLRVQLLTETEYKYLQSLGEFDLKTSSWIQTPDPIRKLGGALFSDRRYDHVFVYHNGCDSYYSARGFRISLCV